MLCLVGLARIVFLRICTGAHVLNQGPLIVIHARVGAEENHNRQL